MAGPELRVCYEDSSLLVLDKPCGLHTAPLASGEEGTLLGLVTQAFPEVAALPGVKPIEPGLIHRLDRETSGLVVVARTVEAFHALRRSFDAGEARKGYLAACAVGPETGEEAVGETDPGVTLHLESRFAPAGPGRRKVRPVIVGERSPRLRAAATRIVYATDARVLKRAAGRAMLEAFIRKGFRHQVRAHLAFLGFPILGDPLYGVEVPGALPPRMYLHAARIELPHPRTGLPLTVESAAPPEFTHLFDEEGT